MWSKEHRTKAEVRTRKLKRYPSKLSDDECSVIAALMPAVFRTGLLRDVFLREVINAIRYLLRSGCGWRMTATQSFNGHSAGKGLLLRECTTVDATIIAAPSSTENQSGARDADVHKTKKGTTWHFGMKAHMAWRPVRV